MPEEHTVPTKGPEVHRVDAARPYAENAPMIIAPRRMRTSAACVLLLIAPALGCATTRVYERERVVDEAMAFDDDDALSYVRNKIEAAREGAFGGFGAAAAGGCGCQ